MILYRWTSAEAVRRVIRSDKIKPSWIHYLPEGCRRGVCLSQSPIHWDVRSPRRQVLLALDCQDLVGTRHLRHIDGDLAWSVTEAIDEAMKTADRCACRLAKTRLAEVGVDPGTATEAFLLTPLTEVSRRLRMVARVRETGDDAEARAAERGLEAQLQAWTSKLGVACVKLSPADGRDLHHDDGGAELLENYLLAQLAPPMQAATGRKQPEAGERLA